MPLQDLSQNYILGPVSFCDKFELKIKKRRQEIRYCVESASIIEGGMRLNYNYYLLPEQNRHRKLHNQEEKIKKMILTRVLEILFSNLTEDTLEKLEIETRELPVNLNIKPKPEEIYRKRQKQFTTRNLTIFLITEHVPIQLWQPIRTLMKIYTEFSYPNSQPEYTLQFEKLLKQIPRELYSDFHTHFSTLIMKNINE